MLSTPLAIDFPMNCLENEVKGVHGAKKWGFGGSVRGKAGRKGGSQDSFHPAQFSLTSLSHKYKHL